MTDIELLDKMFRDNVKVKPAKCKSKYHVVLTEDKCDDSKVTISGIPESAIVIKVDKFPSPDTILSNEQGQCKRADYVIFADCNGNRKAFVVYIEMKRTTDSEKNVIKQLMGAQCFVEYCKSIGKIFWENDSFLDRFHNRFVYFSHTRINKKITRLDKEKIGGGNDKPHKKLNCKGLFCEFNHIVGI